MHILGHSPRNAGIQLRDSFQWNLDHDPRPQIYLAGNAKSCLTESHIQALANIGETEAGFPVQRFRVKAGTVVIDGYLRPGRFPLRQQLSLDGQRAWMTGWLDAMDDGVFDQRLQEQLGDFQYL